MTTGPGITRPGTTPGAMPPSDPATYGDLARRLHEDRDGKLLAEYRQYFGTFQLAAKKKLHEPLAPEEFDTTHALVEGTELCKEVVTAAWESMHS